MEWTEQFESGLDFPLSTDVRIKYAICSTPRCGSHLLGQILYGTGRMGCPLEYFNLDNLRRWHERATREGAEDLVRFLFNIRTSPNGCFGLKAHFPHLQTLARHIPLSDFVTDYAYVHIVRGDILSQAISFARAKQTGDWISRSPTGGQNAMYDSRLIRRCLIEIARQNASWEHLFHAFGRQPLVVTYESLAADPPRAAREVAAFVGVELAADASIPSPRTSRQADSESESWRERFLDEMRRQSAWASLEILQHVPPPVSETRVLRWKQRGRALLGMYRELISTAPWRSRTAPRRDAPAPSRVDAP
jgi:trehalose 2-sulfotransferase